MFDILISMPSPPRILLPDTVVFVTTRTWRDIPFVPTRTMNTILRGIFARAQFLYPVILSAAKMMGNHLHLIIRVKDPEVVAQFMDRIKTESAHAVNCMLGRRNCPVWEDGYDSLPILTIEDVIKKFIYLYTNAQAANLEDTIDAYPGLSSWQCFLDDRTTIDCPWIRRSKIPRLPSSQLSDRQDLFLVSTIIRTNKISHNLKFDHFGWLDCFQIEPETREAVKKKIIDGVRNTEEKLRKDRQIKSISVLGAEALKRRPMDKPFTTQKFARRMWCICSDVPLRIQFINFIKDLRQRAREVRTRWKSGDRAASYPVGLFPPRFPLLANLITREFLS